MEKQKGLENGGKLYGYNSAKSFVEEYRNYLKNICTIQSMTGYRLARTRMGTTAIDRHQW
jgi:hypothetical protein